MLEKYFVIFLISMVPLIELRAAVPIGVGMGVPAIKAIAVCAVGNMLPVPFIYLFARRVLLWGLDKPVIGGFCRFCHEKGEKAGGKLRRKTGVGGLFLALMLFVGIPIPGTGAWTGTLAASFLDMGFKTTVAAVLTGVCMAGCIMALASTGVLTVIG